MPSTTQRVPMFHTREGIEESRREANHIRETSREKAAARRQRRYRQEEGSSRQAHAWQRTVRRSRINPADRECLNVGTGYEAEAAYATLKYFAAEDPRSSNAVAASPAAHRSVI